MSIGEILAAARTVLALLCVKAMGVVLAYDFANHAVSALPWTEFMKPLWFAFFLFVLACVLWKAAVPDLKVLRPTVSLNSRHAVHRMMVSTSLFMAWLSIVSTISGVVVMTLRWLV